MTPITEVENAPHFVDYVRPREICGLGYTSRGGRWIMSAISGEMPVPGAIADRHRRTDLLGIARKHVLDPPAGAAEAKGTMRNPPTAESVSLILSYRRRLC